MTDTYYVCEKCGDFFIAGFNTRKTLQCPFCGAMAAFPCKDEHDANIAIEAVKVRDNMSALINRIKSGDC